MRKALKIIGITVLVSILLLIIGFITTAYLGLSGIGNPIIRYKVKKEITAYITENYPENDFEDVKVFYNFKFGDYGSQIASKTSEDTKFYISYDDGEIEDSFDDYVTNGWNTYMRIEQEFDNQVTQLIKKNYINQVELCLFHLYSSER